MSLKIIEDSWLIKYLGKVVYRLEVYTTLRNENSDRWNGFLKEKEGENIFVYSKVRTDEIAKCTFLENSGFNIIDTNVSFTKQKKNESEKLLNGMEVRYSKPMDLHVVTTIAQNNFIYSRFHLDPQIENEIANTIKGKWVENFYLGKRGDKMVVGVVNGKLVGFLLLLIQNEDLIIDLISVDKQSQGLGIASAMIRFAEMNIPHNKYIVGTQLGNIPSIRLYQKLSFTFSGSEYVFHYHSCQKRKL